MSQNVIEMPGLKRIPDPSFPLGEWGQKTYDKWAKSLFERGHLTEISKLLVEQLAACDQSIAISNNAGKPISTKTLEARSSAIRKLSGVATDVPVSPAQPQANPFQKFGFAARIRSLATG